MSTSDEVSNNGQEATATAETQAITPGQFCWWELGTTDSNGAKAFYTAVFGWSYIDAPMGPDMVYTTFTYNGKSVGSCYNQDKAQIERGVPPNWLSYVGVTSVDDAVAKVAPAGGTVVMGAMDVMEFGRMAVVMDPTNAVFGLWQANTHTGAELMNAEGGVCWTELGTKDANAAKPFYNAVFGWNAEVAPMPGTEYTLFKNGENTAGGMMQITPEMGPIPSHWMPYIAVADCDGTSAKVTANGGHIVMGPMDIPSVGRFAVMRDPQGAHLAFLQPDMSAM